MTLATQWTGGRHTVWKHEISGADIAGRLPRMHEHIITLTSQQRPVIHVKHEYIFTSFVIFLVPSVLKQAAADS
jgi:hypothetical protein